MNSARNTYMGSMVSTASPARLLVLLYDRLVLDLQRAAECQEAGEHVDASGHLMHGQEIVLELQTSLRDDGWAAAGQLSAIYSFLHTRLVQANVRRDLELTRSCLALVEPLASAWREAAAVAVAS